MNIQTLFALQQVGLILFFGFVLAYVLWCVWQFIMWIVDEIAIWRAGR
jgi:hypothetical protein